jgi:hypothetical protein
MWPQENIFKNLDRKMGFLKLVLGKKKSPSGVTIDIISPLPAVGIPLKISNGNLTIKISIEQEVVFFSPEANKKCYLFYLNHSSHF